LVQTLIR